MRESKKTIKVKFVGFWWWDSTNDSTFTYEYTYLMRILRKHYNVVVDEKNPDFVIYSLWESDIELYDAVRIFYSGENCSGSLMQADYIIDFDDYEYMDRHLWLPNYFFFEEYADSITEGMKKKHLVADEMLKKKNAFCSLTSSHETDMRLSILKELSKYKHVDCPGSVGHNIDIPNGSFAVVDFESKHKFSVAFEHHSRADYITEKIVQSFAACTVPVYWGAANVDKYFNPEAMVIIKDEDDIPSAIERIKAIDNDDELYLHMLKQPAILPGMEEKFENAIPNLEKFLCNIFDQEPEEAIRRGTHTHNNYMPKKSDEIFYIEKKANYLKSRLYADSFKAKSALAIIKWLTKRDIKKNKQEKKDDNH